MPQMSPIMWPLIFILMMVTLFLLKSIFPQISNMSFNPSKTSKKTKEMKW